MASSGHPSLQFHSRKPSLKKPSGSSAVTHITYERKFLSTRGPRRIRCIIPASALQKTSNGFAPSFDEAARSPEHIGLPSLLLPLDCDNGDTKPVDCTGFTGRTSFTESSRFGPSTKLAQVPVDVPVKEEEPLVPENKVPWWNQKWNCWCLNFHGRVSFASVKNFQLLAPPPRAEAVEKSCDIAGGASQQDGTKGREEIILQFGRIGEDLFTVDYQHPLSAFQAFGICLTAFGTKLARE